MWSVYINASGIEGIETAHCQGRLVRAVTESKAFSYPAKGYQLRVGNVQQKLSTEYSPDNVRQAAAGLKVGALVVGREMRATVPENGADERD